jgi:hypothetical protein
MLSLLYTFLRVKSRLFDDSARQASRRYSVKSVRRFAPVSHIPNRLAQRIISREEVDDSLVVAEVLGLSPEQREQLIHLLLASPGGRRWLRGNLLSRFPPNGAMTLARRLIAYEEDFRPEHRDSTTAEVVVALPFDVLLDGASFFAGSNAAGPFWRRVAEERPDEVSDVALRVITTAGAQARETTLSILLLDPFSEVKLTGAGRSTVLAQALNDADGRVRGIAADILADEEPSRLAGDLERLMHDPSERVRTAAWDSAFAGDFERARDAAIELALDESAPVESRRTAVTALSAVLTTTEIAPLLEVLVAHPNRALAEDAVNLLWAYHRNPVIATAASQSPHESVRAVAERLLHPETGSPAAGGSRPGAPDTPRDIYQEMIRGYESRDERSDDGDNERKGTR